VEEKINTHWGHVVFVGYEKTHQFIKLVAARKGTI
jgi:hypothetical protein